MPQFRWRGVTIEGKWHSGRATAISPEKLATRMLERGIAVTHMRPIKVYYLWRHVPQEQQAQSLETIALLLESGMPLAEACLVVAETVENPLLQECWVSLADAVERGVGITDQAMLTAVFGSFSAHLLLVGYQAGTFALTAGVSARYAQASSVLRAKLRGALMMPLVTLLFIVALLWLLFVYLVPSLTALFSQFNAEIPSSTRLLLAISAAVQSGWFMLMVGIIVALLGFGFYACKRCGFGSSVVIRLPLVGFLYAQWQRILFVQGLSALLQGGMNLVEALHALADHMPSSAVRAYAAELVYAVSGGVSLSNACAAATASIATPLMIGMMRVGQESNNMVPVLNALAARESAELLSRLQGLTVIVQPALIILLGFAVLAIISAIYMPLINIAQVVQ